MPGGFNAEFAENAEDGPESRRAGIEGRKNESKMGFPEFVS